MSDEVEVEQQDDPVIVNCNHDDTPKFVLVIVALLAFGMGGFAGYVEHTPDKFDPSTPCGQSSAAQKVQMEAQKAEFEWRTSSLKQDVGLRQEIVKSCIDAHKVPVLFNGNIDCKASQ